jgi:hypothetical protein
LTTGLIDKPLGDFTQTQIGPTIAVQFWPGQSGVQLTLANQDLVNTVTIARRPNFTIGGSNTLSIPPLGSVTVDGSKTLWGLAPANTQPLLILPGGGNWAPSPAQVAAQINALGLMKDSTGQTINTTAGGTTTAVNGTTTAVNGVPAGISTTGVPLLNLKSATTLATSQAIAAGATFTPSAITGINQAAYNLHLTGTSGASSTKPWYTVTLKWIDTASGLTVQFDQFVAFMSSTSNVLSTVIYGPADADQLQVAVTNNDTVGMTLNTAYVIISSRVNYTDDHVYQFWAAGGNMPAVATFQIAAAQPVPTEKIIFSVNRSVGIGVTTSPDYAMPVFSGQVYIHFDGTGSNNWDIEFTDQVTGTFVHRQTYTGAPATGNIIAIWPRVPITCHLTNNGSVSGQASLEVVGL